MIFSKSFGYALRGVLYVASACNEKPRIQVDEIARELAVPKHFLSKMMKKIVKHGILNSTKGPYGGFSLNETTLSTSLYELLLITTGDALFQDCVLGLRKCDSNHPCPLHQKIQIQREELYQLLTGTTVRELLLVDLPDFKKSIAIGGPDRN